MSVDSLRLLLDQMRASYQVYRDSHWTVEGSYGNHLLLERIYTETAKQIDALAEMMVGTFGPDIIHGYRSDTGKWVNSFTCPSSPMESSLHAAREVRSSIDSAYDSMEKSGKLGRGWDDLLMSMAQEKDEHIYLLQQATRSPAKHSEGDQPRVYGARGGGRGAGGGRGSGGAGPRGGGPAGPGGRRPGRRHPGGGPGMGRGRGRRRRHRRHGINVYPYWNLPYDVYYPVYYPAYEEVVPTVESVTPHFDGSTAVIILQGYGFNAIPGNSVHAEWSAGGSKPIVQAAPITNRNDQSLEIRISFPGGAPDGLEILGVAYSTNYGELVLLTGPFSMAKRRKRFAQTSSAPAPRAPRASVSPRPSAPPPSSRPPSSRPPSVGFDPTPDIPGATPLPHPGDIPGFQYQPGYGSAMAPGAASTSMEPSKMEYMMPPNRMLEPHRSGILHRQLGHQTGRRFGVPGFVPGQPGWGGQAGVAQSPHPTRGMSSAPVDRTFGPGLSAGQGGVQTFAAGGGPMAVQTYGSLGYASMGDGSMDMASRGSIQRRYSQADHGIEEITVTAQKRFKSIKKKVRSFLR